MIIQQVVDREAREREINKGIILTHCTIKKENLNKRRNKNSVEGRYK